METAQDFLARGGTRAPHQIAGVDEAGRGPWAGPVLAAAVILGDGLALPGLDDSKKLSEAARERLFDRIAEGAVAYAIAEATREEIDRLNIRGATLLAMRRALSGLKTRPALALIDGRDCPGGEAPERAVIDGDALIAEIAAASILAKVARDRLMRDLDRTCPGYGFARHKGYGTPAHAEALARLGPSPAHRLSFAPVARALALPR